MARGTDPCNPQKKKTKLRVKKFNAQFVFDDEMVKFPFVIVLTSCRYSFFPLCFIFLFNFIYKY